ncbi:MAG: hypothetical protein ACLR9Z_00305 [Alitiscatomonas sp.]
MFLVMQLGISKKFQKEKKESALIMRKQTKIAAVVSAAALLALGASITSFAAAKGTWMMVDGEWYCYDKNGDVYENTFCSSNGKEYYVGDDGMLVRSSWVEYDGDYYFVNSSGAKIVNDWRLTTPYEDEDADEEWFYFQSTGKRADNKKILYKGSTFFFDADGKMLTGWVTADGNDVVNEENGINTSYTFFCDETGARVESSWVYTTEPATADDDADADEYWYYLKSSGKVATGKQTNIKGQAFILGNQSDNLGQMLTGWVGGDYDSSDKSYAYKEIDEENSTTKLSEVDVAYYCLYDEDKADGHVQENKWVKTWRPEDAYDEDEDDDKFWYWLEKDGKAYIPVWKDDNAGDFVGIAYKYALGDGTLEVKNDGEAFSIAKKKINSKDYFFNKDGEMVNNFIHVVEAYKDSKDPAKAKNKIDLGMYYFGGSNDGSMKTGSQTIKDDNDDSFKFYFGTKDSATEKKGVGITGNKNNKLYYEGHLVAAEDYKYQPVKVLGATFIVNQNGSIQHSNVEYKEDGDVLINAKNEKDSAGNDLKVAFETVGQYKYAVTPGTVGNVEFYVDYLDPEVIMSTSDSEDITASVPTVLNAIAE